MLTRKPHHPLSTRKPHRGRGVLGEGRGALRAPRGSVSGAGRGRKALRAGQGIAWTGSRRR